MRDKENAHDYRYFAEPDLPPLIIEQNTIDQIRTIMPELPKAKCARFQEEFELSEYDAELLTSDKDLADFFERTASKTAASKKLTANWVSGELLAYLNKDGISINESPVDSDRLADLLDHIADNTISGKIAKTILDTMWTSSDSVKSIIESQGLSQISDTSALKKIIADIIKQHPNQVADYRSGKDRLFGFFVGQVMKATKGRANPAMINDLLKSMLQ